MPNQNGLGWNTGQNQFISQGYLNGMYANIESAQADQAGMANLEKTLQGQLNKYANAQAPQMGPTPTIRGTTVQGTTLSPTAGAQGANVGQTFVGNAALANSANIDQTLTGQDRAQNQSLINALQAQANGTAPSIAQMQAKNSADQAS